MHTYIRTALHMTLIFLIQNKSGGFWTEGVSEYFEFNLSFLNEAKANLIAAHTQVRTPYWLPIVKFFHHNLNSGSMGADQTQAMPNISQKNF